MDDFKTRFEKFMEEFYEQLNRYESKHPDLLQETLREIIGMNLYNLKEAIENPDVPEVSWEKPEMTVQYPVQFDFKKLWPFYAEFSPEDLDIESVDELMWQVRMFYALRAMTLDAAILKQEGKYYFLHATNRDMAPEEQYEAWKQWEESGNTVISIPIPLGVDEDTGQELNVTVKVQFWPLEIDKDAGQAYYPVSIWLDSSYPLIELSEDDRREIWRHLIVFFISPGEEVDQEQITRPKAYYPGPTAIERMQYIFGEAKPTQGKLYQPYIGPVERHYIYSGVFKEPVQIQLELPGIPTQYDLEKLDRMVPENTDVLALKVFHAVFSECYRQRGKWLSSCYWDANTFCDLLGYKRDSRGYHRTANVAQVEKRLRMLSNLTYRFELLGYDRKTEADRIVFEGPLITIEPRQTVSLFKRKTRIAKKSTLRIHDELYSNMTERKMFAWFDNEFLKLHPQTDKRAILLYSYYCCQLSMGVSQRREPKNVVKRPVKTVLRETGIRIGTQHRHRHRDAELFIKAHRELKKRGLVRDYSLPLNADLLLHGEVEIVFHGNHPALKYQRSKSLSVSPSEDT